MKNPDKFTGLVAAPFTPMRSDGSLNSDMIPEYYNFLVRNGVSAAFINGSTGEGPSLTSKEKTEQAARWADCRSNDGKLRLINLVGGTSLGECIDSAFFSKEAGFSAIAVLAPYYFKPDAGHLAEFVARIGESVPELPLYFYHIPSLTGVNVPMISFLERISGMVPSFAGIKFTHEDFMDYLSCLNFRDGYYDILWGRDECLLSALVLGCTGAVGSTYNYAAPLYLRIIRSFNEGKMPEAASLQQKSVDMIRLLGKYGGMATGKSYMKYIGYDLGKFRLPVNNMTDDNYRLFSADVRKLDMEDLFSR